MKIFSWFKKKIKPKQAFNQVYILENEIKIPITYLDELNREEHFSYSYGYENGWLKICLWGGTAYKKKVEESEIEKIIEPIRTLNLKEDQVHKHLTNIGGFEPWDYYTEYFKAETIYL